MSAERRHCQTRIHVAQLEKRVWTRFSAINARNRKDRDPPSLILADLARI